MVRIRKGSLPQPISRWIRDFCASGVWGLSVMLTDRAPAFWTFSIMSAVSLEVPVWDVNT